MHLSGEARQERTVESCFNRDKSTLSVHSAPHPDLDVVLSSDEAVPLAVHGRLDQSTLQRLGAQHLVPGGKFVNILVVVVVIIIIIIIIIIIFIIFIITTSCKELLTCRSSGRRARAAPEGGCCAR
jgi:hypothetical protein